MVQAQFIPGSPTTGGQRLALFHQHQGDRLKGLVLYVHPFAEEMNKARRMAALQSRDMAQAGYAVLQIDLLGCGDSTGEFADASWDAWVDDVLTALRWLQQQGDAPLWLWGLRSGCLLAAQAARQLSQPAHFLFWQPTPSGKNLLQQFLRLKMAAELQGGQAKTVMEGLRTALADGRTVDVAGYGLSPGMAQGLEAASLTPPVQGGRLVWLELSTRPDASLMPVSAATLGAWQNAGFDVRSQVVTGPAFWQTTEMEDAPALLQATLQALSPSSAH